MIGPKAPLALLILDGWGIGDPNDPMNAIAVAKTPVMDRLWVEYPHSTLLCSGEAVGLPDGQMGNSEVGHLNLGAGRVVYQELTRINKAIREGDFYENLVLNEVMDEVKASGKALHLMGLESDGGVHSMNTHLYALLELAKRKAIETVWIHCFLDGRDVPPQSALNFIKELEAIILEIGVGQIATIEGRYYAMDRDKRWERIQKAYDAVALGKGLWSENPEKAIKASYEREEWDEFVQPTVIGNDYPGILPNDGVIFFDFRPDRARQLTRVLTDPTFTEVERDGGLIPIHMVTFTQYEERLDVKVAFPPQEIHDTLGEIIAAKGLKQLRIAETEKYAHVTFFFNGGEETPNPGEERILIPSPKVATYDLQPAMSAEKVTDKLIEEIKKEEYSMIILNFANGDMVGHTGFLDAAVEAVETVDTCLGRILEVLLAHGGTALVTADHGNAETMTFPDGSPLTSHTTNPVPLILVSNELKNAKLKEGKLADVAPTLFDLADIPIPAAMTGKSLLVRP